MFVPYGRGGSGFSVLDVTNPIVENSVGPLHMFSVYNDFINNKVYIMDYKGEIKDGGYDYRQTQFNLTESREALRADRMYNEAAEDDNEGTDTETYTNRSAIDECKDDDDYTTGKFKDVGTTSCYESKVFNFDTALGADGTVFGSDTFDVFNIEGATKTRVNYSSA